MTRQHTLAFVLCLAAFFSTACEQTSIAVAEQAAPPGAICRNSHPPMVIAATPVIASAAVAHRCWLPEAPGAGAPGPGLVAAGSAGTGAERGAVDLRSVGASTAGNGVVTIW